MCISSIYILTWKDKTQEYVQNHNRMTASLKLKESKEILFLLFFFFTRSDFTAKDASPPDGFWLLFWLISDC